MAAILKEALRFKKEQGLTLGGQRAGQKQAGYFPTGNREPIGERLDTKVHRAALPHDRSKSTQLA